MSVRTLVLQPASATAFHCYARGDAPFVASTPARVLVVEGVRSVHLVTAGRPQDRWCLVLEPDLTVEQGNAERLEQLARRLASQLGLNHLRLLRPVERRDGGPASDIYDWLKW